MTGKAAFFSEVDSCKVSNEPGFGGDGVFRRVLLTSTADRLGMLQVVDEAGRIVRPGTPGQLCTRGYNIMMGYWEDPQKTEETFSAGRWLLTG